MRVSLSRLYPACRPDSVPMSRHSSPVDHDHRTEGVGLAVRSPYQVLPTCEERSELESLSRRASAQCRQVLRARIILAAADGTSNAVIADRLGICVDTVCKWRSRFCDKRYRRITGSSAQRPATYLPGRGGGRGQGVGL
ncbi:helix-turn-helix domain-containing protein [Rhodococcus sp. CX]|uniref:helix-turn-helix domain-containing protein n=1 Tax=Rhodococcus sp. CX TaxID=2789880 RepID=UPI0035A86AAC